MTRVRWKFRDTNEHFEVDLDDGEYRWFASQRDKVIEAEPSEERTEILTSVCNILEMKVRMGARIIPLDEQIARGLTDEVPVNEDATTETLARMAEMEGRGFKFPDSVKQKMAEGQTSLLDSPAPRPPSGPLRMPYRDGPDEAEHVVPVLREERAALSEQAERMAPAYDEGRVAPPAEPVMTPVGTPGVYGGRVPAFTVAEASQAFATWKATEFGWLKTRVLLLAREHGEYHSEMLVGVGLTNRNLIGALTNSLASQDLMEMLNRRGDPETRISSNTSRRKSNVWRLTITGRAMADDLAASEQVAMWAFPERSYA